jgi:hypothetical protein
MDETMRKGRVPMDHFKLTMKNVSAAIQNKDTRMEVKVVGASHKSRYE